MISIHERERALNGATVLVTGAGGFIGSHLVERLLRLGSTVNLGYGSCISIRELVRTIGKLVSRDGLPNVLDWIRAGHLQTAETYAV